MKKIFTKLIGVTLGLAMAVGVGVGVAANNRKATMLDATLGDSIAGGDMSDGPITGWTASGTGKYSGNGIKFDSANDYIQSPDISSHSLKDVKVSIKAGHNGGQGSNLRIASLDDSGDIIAYEDFVPTEAYNAQSTVYDFELSGSTVIKNIRVTMTSKTNNLGMKYCEVFDNTSGAALTPMTAPTISLSGTIVSWGNIADNNGYSYSITGEESKNGNLDTDTTSLDVSSLGLAYGNYSITVITRGNGSTTSNSVSSNSLNFTLSEPSVSGEFNLFSGTLVEGDYVVCSGSVAMKNATTSAPRIDVATPTISDNKITNPKISIVWHIAKDGDYWTFYNSDVDKYAAFTGTDGRGTLIESVTDYARFTTTGSYDFINVGKAGKYLRYNNTYGFASYGSGTGSTLTLYKKFVAATSISLDNDELLLGVGSQGNLTATLTPAGADSSVTWSSDAENVATVNQSGVVTGVAAGSATITARVSELIFAECEVTVTAAAIPAESVTLNKNSNTLVVGQTDSLTATVLPANTTDELVWSTTNPSVATVENGLVTAVAAGSATIRATAGEQSAEYALTVNALNALTAYVGANIDAVGKLMFKNGKTAIIDDGTGAFWAYATSNVSQDVGETVRVQGSIVNYNNRGGLEINNATISDSDASVTPSTPAQLNESEALNYISLFNASTDNTVPHRRVSMRTGTIGGEGNFLTWTWPEGTALLETNISKGSMVAGKVYDIDGYLVNFYKSGDDTYLCVCVIDAQEPVIAPESVSLNETSVQIEIGAHSNLVATLSPNGASGNITWSSDAENVATVNQSGVVTGVAAGSATITARVSESIYAECEVTVITPVRSMNGKLFEADLTSDASVTTGFTITPEYYSQKSGYYQDGSGTTTFTVSKGSALFANEPAEIKFTARLGAGSNVDSFSNPVQVCFIDSNGDVINSTVTTVKSGSIDAAAANYVVSIPYSADAYGVKLTHAKENGYNIRFYSFELSYSYSQSIATVHGTETNDGNSITVSDVYMKFNASIRVSTWNQLGTISNYGVMLFKRAALNGLYTDTDTPVKDAFRDGRTLTVFEKGNGEISNPDGDFYNFSAKIRVSDSNKYGVVVCAAPFVVIDGTYYFLDEMEYSVHTLAQHCITNGGSNLSNEALALL